MHCVDAVAAAALVEAHAAAALEPVAAAVMTAVAVHVTAAVIAAVAGAAAASAVAGVAAGVAATAPAAVAAVGVFVVKFAEVEYVAGLGQVMRACSAPANGAVRGTWSLSLFVSISNRDQIPSSRQGQEHELPHNLQLLEHLALPAAPPRL